MRFRDEDFLFKTEQGVSWYYAEDDENIYIGSSQDPTPVIEQNLANFNSGATGWTSDKTFRHIGSVPVGVIESWKADGVDLYDENCAKEVIRRMNSSEYRLLRSSDWKV